MARKNFSNWTSPLRCSNSQVWYVGYRGRLGAVRFESGRFELAARLFEDMMTREDFPEFMTLAAYEYLD